MSAPLSTADLELRPAGVADLPIVRAILLEAAAWLHARDIRQWPLEWATEEEAYVRQRIACGELFVAWLGGEPVATIVLQWADEPMWGARPADAGYVHRLAVRRAYAGRGLGRALLVWAAARVVDAGRQFLRLDCMADNQRLCRYYAALGFGERGIVGNDRWQGRLYEQPAACLLAAHDHEVNHAAPA